MKRRNFTAMGDKKTSILSKITGLVMFPLLALAIFLCVYFIYSIYGFSKYSNRENLNTAASGAIYAFGVSNLPSPLGQEVEDINKINALLKELKNSTLNDYSLYVGEQKVATTSPGQILEYSKADNLENGDMFFNNVPNNGNNCCVYVKNFDYYGTPCKIEVINSSNNSFGEVSFASVR